MLETRFYIDESFGSPHIHKHGITEQEIDDFFNEIDYYEDIRPDGSFVAYGRLHNGRCIQVAFRKEAVNSVFVITAYDIEDREMLQILEDYYSESH